MLANLLGRLVAWGCLCLILGLGLFLETPRAIAASSSALKVADELEKADKNYAGMSLIQKEFVSTDLAGANFSGADLRGTVFNGANLSGANLHGADLSDAMLYVSNLSEADLTEANLTATMLLKTNLSKADITGADFSYATVDREQLFALCERASGINPTTGVETRDSLECP